MGELSNFFVSFGAITKEFQKGKEEVEQGLKEVSSAAEAQGRAMEESGKQGEEALKQTGRAAEEATEKTNRLKESFQNTAQAMRKLGTEMKIAGGIITGALTAIVLKTAEYADNIDDMTKRTGLSAEELTRWGFVAEQNGSSLEQMSMALKKLYASMYEASNGSKQAQEMFANLGISVKDANGNLKTATDIIPEIADAIANMGSEIEQSAAAAKIFGMRVGPQLLPMLQLGGKGIKELSDEADRLGRTMSSVTAQQIGNFNDAITSLKAAIGGLSVQFVQSLAPALQSLVERLTNVLARFNEWGKNNQALFDSLSKIALLSGPLLIVAGTFLTMATRIIVLQAEVAKLGGIFTILQGTVKGFFSFFTSPAGIAVSAIAAIGTAVYTLYSRWEGLINRTKQARDALISLKDGTASIEEIKSALDTAEETIQKNIKAIQTWHKNMDALATVTKGLSEVFNRLFKIEENATGKILAETAKLEAEMDKVNEAYGRKLAEGLQGASEETKNLVAETIKYRQEVLQNKEKMDLLRVAIENLKKDLSELTPKTDAFRETENAIKRLEKEYQELFETAGEAAFEYNKRFRLLNEEQQQLVLTGKQKEKEIIRTSLTDRLEMETNFSKLIIDEQIKVLEAYRENSKDLTEEEMAQIDDMIKVLREKFNRLNEATRERMKYAKALLDLGKITDIQYLQFLENEVVSEKNTAEQKKSIRDELLSYTVSLYNKNLDELKNSNQKAVNLEKDTAEKRKEIYTSYVQEVAKREEEINQIRQKYSDKRQDLEKSMRVQLIEELAGYGKNINKLFSLPTEELAKMWKSYASSGKSLKPLTEDAQKQLDVYASAWEEAGKRIELASKVEEYLNLDMLMQDEINKVNEQFAEFEAKTAEALINVNNAFLETAVEAQNSFVTAFDNINTAMGVLEENFGIHLDNIENKLKEFSGAKIEPVETATEDLVAKTLPSVEALREHAKLLEKTSDVTHETVDRIKINAKSQEELAREIYNQKRNLTKVISDIKESGVLEATHEIITYSTSGGVVGKEYKKMTEPVKTEEPALPDFKAILPPEIINQSTQAVKGLGNTFKQDFVPISTDVSKSLLDMAQNIGDFKGSLGDAVNAVTALNRELAKLAGQNIKVAIDVQGTEKAGQQIVYDAISSSLRAGERV